MDSTEQLGVSTMRVVKGSASVDPSFTVTLAREYDGKDANYIGAFPCGSFVKMTVSAPSIMKNGAVVMRVAKDGCPEVDTKFSYLYEKDDREYFEYVFDTDKLCEGRGYGLFFYEILFIMDGRTFITSSINNVDFELVAHEGEKFYMTVYEKDFKTPDWFGKGVMYHVFVDRFCKGEGNIGTRDDAEINTDWDNGIPQYPHYPGADLKNNVFFGGNLWGVAEKLGYLESLGVSVIYLSPIFKAYSNHKYDTGDYLTIDEMFGGEAALTHLVKEAKKRGMRIILDGVFNHTGDDSLYFNRYGKYPSLGAYQSQNSPYRDWFCFKNGGDCPDEYESWWGIKILPKLNHRVESCRKFFTAPGGVAQKYISEGIGGWRLDVADELSDDFLDEFRETVKRESDGEGVIIGEVWENAATKIAYGVRRRYLAGSQLDSVMNYPVRSGILSFVRWGDAEMLYNTLVELYGSYPPCVSHSMMNLLGTHDTERIITVLGSQDDELERPNCELAVARLSRKKREYATRLLKIAATLQYTIFGIPSVFYGDEVGLEGYRDPFCRMPFPWSSIDTPERADILDFYRKLGELRRDTVFDGGDFEVLDHGAAYIIYTRTKDSRQINIAANRSSDPIILDYVPNTEILLSSGEVICGEGVFSIGADSVCVWKLPER